MSGDQDQAPVEWPRRVTKKWIEGELTRLSQLDQEEGYTRKREGLYASALREILRLIKEKEGLDY